jgi:hypothetical protein
MPTVQYQFTLNAGDNFVTEGSPSWDTLTHASGKITANETLSSSGATYTGTMKQAATTNNFEELGVPAGRTVTGLRLVSSRSEAEVTALNTTFSKYLKLALGGVIIGEYDIDGSSESIAVNNPDTSITPVEYASDADARFEVTLRGVMAVDPDQSPIELRLYDFTIEITYETPGQGRMFFAS